LSALERDIAAGVDAAVATATPLRVQPNAGGRGDVWGPASQRITSPQQLLAQVADHAQKLHEQMLSLTASITGEAPPPMRLRQAPRPGGGLLPLIANLAHEIETVHAEMAGLIAHLKGKVSP